MKAVTEWTAGRVEVAVAPNWTGGPSRPNISMSNFLNPGIAGTGFKDTENVIRAGVNFKFLRNSGDEPTRLRTPGPGSLPGAFVCR